MISHRKSSQRIGHRLREIRRQKGLLQIDLAVASDIDRTYISRIENGKARVTFNLLLQLVKGLDIESQDLI